MNRVLAPHLIRYVVLGCAVLGTVFLFLLATASANTSLFAGNYTLLVVLNLTLVVVLMALVAYQLWRLRRNLKAGVFGSRLAARLVLLFALVAVLPGALLYGVSIQFLGKSIESWFDVRVDRALEGGLNLGRNALEYLLKETSNKATQLALTIEESERGGLASSLNRASEQAGIYEAALFSSTGGVLAVGGISGSMATPEPPPPQALQRARVQKTFAAIEEGLKTGHGMLARDAWDLYCPDSAASEAMRQFINDQKTAKDTAGGIVEACNGAGAGAVADGEEFSGNWDAAGEECNHSSGR